METPNRITEALKPLREMPSNETCIRCGSAYLPHGQCSRHSDGCQGGRGEQPTQPECPKAVALREIAALDFKKTVSGGDDFYSGPDRFLTAWNIADRALASPAPCGECERLREKLAAEMRRVDQVGNELGHENATLRTQLSELEESTQAAYRKHEAELYELTQANATLRAEVERERERANVNLANYARLKGVCGQETERLKTSLWQVRAELASMTEAFQAERLSHERMEGVARSAEDELIVARQQIAEMREELQRTASDNPCKGGGYVSEEVLFRVAKRRATAILQKYPAPKPSPFAEFVAQIARMTPGESDALDGLIRQARELEGK